MQVTRIDIEGKPGYYATIQRKKSQYALADFLVVELLTPDKTNGQIHYLDCDDELSFKSEAKLLFQKIGDPENSTAADYHNTLLNFSDF